MKKQPSGLEIVIFACLLIFFFGLPAFFTLHVNASQSEKPDLGVGASLHGRRPFPPNNPWNQDISKEPVDPNSAALIASIGLERGLHPDFGTQYGIPYVVVPGNQPRVPVKFQYADESDPGPYPIPPNPPIEEGDRHILILDRDHWFLYELYKVAHFHGTISGPRPAVFRAVNPFGTVSNCVSSSLIPRNWSLHPRIKLRGFRDFSNNASPDAGGWKADSGAVFNLSSNKLRPAGWTSADAAGLPIFPGLVRYDEVVEQKAILHALRFTVRRTRRAYVAPARHDAGRLTDSNLPPMGMRVRLKANYDISSFSPHLKIILTALKKYGMFVADNGSNWYLTGSEDRRWNDDELHALSRVKGKDFEVLKMPRI